MGNLFTERSRVLNDDDAYRSYLISRNQSPIVYRSRKMQLKRLRVVGRHARNHISAFLTFIHDAIVAAKMRRVQRELMFHGRAEKDVGGFPQRPLILGDKWDF